MKITKIMRIKYFFIRWKIFGFFIAFWGFFPLKYRKHEIILSYLYKNFKYIIDRYANKTPEKLTPISPDSAIWVCWWQGEEAMPKSVMTYFSSVKRHSGTHPVILITKDNVNDYITIPSHIIKKVDEGIISITHLSDIIRSLLLAKHGGLWLDATVLVTGNINFTNMPFFTVNRDLGSDYVSRQRWAQNCIGGTAKIYLFDFVNELFSEYWKKYNILIDYFLIDYSIMLAYNHLPYIREMIDNVPLNNKNYQVLKKLLEKEFDQDLYNEIIKDTIFHKLAYNFKTMTKDNKLTYYGYIMNNHNL
jgi:hypothetical protein